MVLLTIQDNGRGLPAIKNSKRSSLGMVGMRARAREIGGELTITNRPEGGIRIEVSAPVHRLAHESR